MTDTRTDDAVRTAIQQTWAGLAPAWGAHADELEARIAPITARMLDAVRLRPGERVLELACGPGGAGLAAAERVGPTGAVVLSDVVAEMATVARARAAARGLGNITVEVLDLEAIAQPDQSYDVVLCREGLMFALDPGRAAHEFQRVLRPAGRLAVSVWGSKGDNPWLGLLLDALADATGSRVPGAGPGGPGPFALGDPDHLRELFAGAGFRELAVEPVAAPVRVPSFDAWWSRSLTLGGPAVGILNRLDAHSRDRVKEAARAAASPYETGGALVLPGLAFVLTGRRP